MTKEPRRKKENKNRINKGRGAKRRNRREKLKSIMYWGQTMKNR
jgi:hypothetical protein